MLQIDRLIIEGVDCSGKSTLYRRLHELTNFKYNIHDRSALSMLCYARLYNRDESPYRTALRSELCNANHFIVVLAPTVDVILRRFHDRGDEAQDELSLVRLHHIFEEEVRLIENLPNVLVIRDEISAGSLVDLVATSMLDYSNKSPGNFGKTIHRWCALTPRSEVQLSAVFELSDKHDDRSILNDVHEGEYYNRIIDDVYRIIDRERQGNNSYGIPQGVDSRRFYYHSDTCISSIHFLPRGGHLKVLCALRSTDAVRNGSLDLRFLSHLSTTVASSYPDWHIDKITLSVTFNSLHIRAVYP